MFAQEAKELLVSRDPRDIPDRLDFLELQETPVTRDSLVSRVFRAIKDLLDSQVIYITFAYLLFAYRMHEKHLEIGVQGKTVFSGRL